MIINQSINNLEKSIKEIQTKEEKTEEDIKLIQEKKNFLKFYYEKKRMEGVLLRSKARWVAEGEKITNYFCSLEKRNFISKQMKKIVDKNGSVLEKPNAIMNEVQCFYERLYKSSDVEYCVINDLISKIPELSEVQQVSLEGEITLEEAGTVLKYEKWEMSRN